MNKYIISWEKLCENCRYGSPFDAGVAWCDYSHKIASEIDCLILEDLIKMAEKKEKK